MVYNKSKESEKSTRFKRSGALLLFYGRQELNINYFLPQGKFQIPE